MAIIGLFIGLAFALAMMVLFVSRPGECGEPAACGDEYLFPTAYFAFVALAGFPALGIYAGGASTWRACFRPVVLGSVTVALGMLAFFIIRSVVRHA